MAESDRGWLPGTLARSTWALAAATGLGAMVVAIVGEPGPAVSAWIMVALVGLVGLPHGAYDMAVARRLLSGPMGRSWWPVFVGAYLALAAVAAGLWMVAPWVGLVSLLTLGAFHWGADDLAGRTGVRWVDVCLIASRGAVPVALPLAFHPSETAVVFAGLVGAEWVSASMVGMAGAVAAAIAAPGVVGGIVLAWREETGSGVRSVAEVGALVAWFAVVGPILAFAVYFCLWHSARHSLRSMARIDGSSLGRASRWYAAAVAWPTVATWALALAAWPVVAGGAVDPSGLWRVVFIGLFALTVPHVVLEAMDEQRPGALGRAGMAPAPHPA